LEIIDEVIARCDSREQFVHLRRTLFARLKECVRHFSIFLTPMFLP
jgi:hypothetical protein